MGVQIDGDMKRLIRKMNTLSNIDFKGTNAALGEALRTSTRERFKKQKSPEGKAWKKSIRASTEGGVTLTDSAVLKNSIRSRSSNTGFAIGTNAIYAAPHQFGDIGRKITIKAKTARGLTFQIGGHWVHKKQVTVTTNTPARPFLGINDDDLAEIKKMINQKFMEG